MSACPSGGRYQICAHITLIKLDISSIFEKSRVPYKVKSREKRGLI